MFLESSAPEERSQDLVQTPTPPHDTPPKDSNSYGLPTSVPSPSLRYNENSGSVKRRRVDTVSEDGRKNVPSATKSAPRGPFYDDSDDETEAAKLLREDGNQELPTSIIDCTNYVID